MFITGETNRIQPVNDYCIYLAGFYWTYNSFWFHENEAILQARLYAIVKCSHYRSRAHWRPSKLYCPISVCYSAS